MWGTTSRDLLAWSIVDLVSWHAHTGNHWGILEAVGYKDIRQYRYYKKETRGLDSQGMIEDLKVCLPADNTPV